MVHNSMNTFKSPKLNTLDGWITWDMNYIFKKLLHFLLQFYRRYSSFVQFENLFLRRKTLRWKIEIEWTENINELRGIRLICIGLSLLHKFELENNALNRILLVFLQDEHTRPNLENWIYFWKIENYSGSRLSYQDLNFKLWWISVSSRMKNQLYSECRMVYILII